MFKVLFHLDIGGNFGESLAEICYAKCAREKPAVDDEGGGALHFGIAGGV